MKKIKIEKVVKDMEKMLKDMDSNQFDQIPWIISKVVRITMSQYHLIDLLSEQEYKKCIDATKRVADGESVSDIFGELEFYGNFFEVLNDVFYPRLTTQTLVDMVKENVSNKENLKILDLCTGTGCVAITLSKIFNASALGVDISPSAITLANKNKLKLNAPKSAFKIMDLMNDWSKVLTQNYDVIVSNPPYWTIEKILNRQEVIRNNPLNAFDGGVNGIEFHKKIIKNAPGFLKNEGKLFLEMEEDQELELRKLLEKNFTKIQIAKDSSGQKRVIFATLKTKK